MKITDTSGVNGSGKPKKPKKTGDKGAFDALLNETEAADGTDATQAAKQTEAIEATTALFSMQEVSGDQGLRQQTLQQGRNSLQILDELRRDLLLGEDNAHTLQRMREQQKRMKQQVFDPQLKPVMDDIDLRLAVEIAKREDTLV